MSVFSNVMVGVDLDEAAAHAILDRACQVAEPGEIEAVFVCDHVNIDDVEFPYGYYLSNDLDEELRHRATRFLREVCQPLGIRRRTVLDGTPAGALHAHAHGQADLVVIGSHGRRGLMGMVGSTSNQVLHGTECDVLAVHLPTDAAGAVRQYEHVLAAIDLSVSPSSDVLNMASAVTRQCQARLSICHVSARADEDSDRSRLAMFGNEYGVPDADRILARGRDVAAEIHAVANARGVDLVVIGTRGKHGLALLAGSTANAVLHGISCDMLSVRLR